MGLFENSHFPYTNFHELNLDKIVDVTKDAKETAEQAETTANAATATVGTFDARITQNAEDIANAQDRITGVNAAVAIHSNQITDLIEADSTLGSRITTLNGEVSGLTQRVTAAEGNIDTLETDKTYCEVTQGTLDAGVLVGTITQQLTPDSPIETINLYAPTAGSTVVRAVDVPFNTTGVTPAMSGNTVQAAIEELNTGIADGLSELNHQTIEPDQDNYLNYKDDNLTEQYSSSNNDLEYLFEKIVSNLKGMFMTMSKNVYYDNESDRINLNASIYNGYISAGNTNIYLFIPYNKIVKRYDGYIYGTYHPVTNPIDNPNNYTWSMDGNIYVRGTNGYVLQNVSLSGSGVTAIDCTPTETGIQVKLTVPAVSGATTNTPVTAYFAGSAYIEFNS